MRGFGGVSAAAGKDGLKEGKLVCGKLVSRSFINLFESPRNFSRSDGEADLIRKKL